MNVLKTVKPCLTYDLSADDYFVVPLVGGGLIFDTMKKRWGFVQVFIGFACAVPESGDYKILQRLIKKNVNTDVRRPTADEIRSETYDCQNYIGSIIAPYYRDTEKVSIDCVGVCPYSRPEIEKKN